MNARRMLVIAILLLSSVVSALAAPTPAQSASVPDKRPTSALASLPFINAEDVRRTFSSLELSKVGDSLAQKGAWKEAKSHYQDALSLWKDSPDAHYGLARCYHALGDGAKEIDAYRAAIYSTNPAGKGFGEIRTDKLMTFALLLVQTGQTDEAVYVYHHAAANLNYIDGKPNLKVMLPAFGDAEGQLPYSPQALQAMAHVGIAAYSQDEKEKLANLDAAIKLQPDMPQAYYYKGYALYGKPGQDRAALTAYQQARHFAGIDTQLLIDKEVNDIDLEKGAALEQAREKQKAAPKK